MSRLQCSRGLGWVLALILVWGVLSIRYGPAQMPKDLLTGIWALQMECIMWRSDAARELSDMRTMHTAIETYRLDHGACPPEVAMAALAADPDWVRERGEAGMTTMDIARITSPVAYVSNGKAMEDVFATDIVPRLYDRGSWFTKGRVGPGRAHNAYVTDGRRFLIASRGPNTHFDAPDLRALLKPGRRGEWPPPEILHYSYDPTNGSASAGDIFRYTD